MLQQRTLKSLTRAVGVGLHSGQKVELTLRPAAPDTGIVFRRVDLPHPVDIPVGAASVCDTRLATMGYGRRLLAAVPPMRVLKSNEEFLETLSAFTRTSTTDPAWT